MGIRKRHSFLKSTIIVALLAIVMKMIGFFRQAIIASFYGVSSNMDAYFFAQNMPAMIFPAVCTSISTAFISLYVSKSVTRGESEGDKFAASAFIASISISIALSILALIFAPVLVKLLAPGFTKETIELAIYLTRLTMGSFVLIMAQYMLAGILNSRKFFYSVKVAGILNNIFIITVLMILGSGQSVKMLTLTVVAGHFVQVMILFWFSKNKISFSILESPFTQDIKKMLLLAVPILFGNSVVQLNHIVDKAIASTIEAGAISALSYSNALNSVVTGVFIATLSTVLYPNLSEKASQMRMTLFSGEISQSIKLLLIFIIPITIITIIFSEEIVMVVFERGSFDHDATLLTATALKYYALGYAFLAVQQVVIRGFYAIQDTKTPLINSSVAVFINIILSILLSKVMGLAGLVLATSISTAISSIIIYKLLKFKVPEFKMNNINLFLFKSIIAGICTGIALVYIKSRLVSITPFNQFTCAVIIGFSVYYSLLYILKTTELLVAFKRIFKMIKSSPY